MSAQTVCLDRYVGPIKEGDRDANFKRDVVLYTRIDPMPTIETMSRYMDIPVGAIVRYILVKWATSGSEGTMEIGPRVVRQMAAIVHEAEESGEDAQRIQAYRKLAGITSWLNTLL
jgi:hypothetical protein